jgi:hypothetical protein
MLRFTKRQFARLAGLAIADRIIPRWLRAEPAPGAESARKLIVVTFGGGVRYAETFTPEGLRNIPRLAELQPQGRFFKDCVNSGVLSHYNSTASILTGNWQRVDDFGFERPASPTVFEYYRRATKARALDAWAICTNKSFQLIGSSSLHDWGAPWGANVVLPKQLLLDAVEDVVRRNPRQGVADRDNVLRQLNSILAEGYEGVGWTVFQGSRDMDRSVRETLTRGLAEFIHGPEAPSSGDELTFFITREVMREFKPRVILVNFWDMDVAHWGSYSLYLQAITKTDRLCAMLWEEINSNAAYKDRTILMILPELGRDGDQNTANGFLNHRSGDPACRNAWLLALGAGIEKGVTERPITHVDVAATAAAVLGARTGEMAGRRLPEVGV